MTTPLIWGHGEDLCGKCREGNWYVGCAWDSGFVLLVVIILCAQKQSKYSALV
jgi:hypothetical protein